ncbi:MAG: FAD-dependent oxidoreductase, partial [Halocynthiibacter sp.]
MKDANEKPGGGRYDLIVLGAGSAGFSAAITAADAGKSVALVGHGTIGGTCVNVGCVPSKFMIRAAETQHGAAAASRFPGIAAEARVTDWPALVRGKRDLVSALRQKKYADLLPEYESVTYIEGAARFETGGVRVGSALLSAPKVLIATGGRPSLPSIPGIKEVATLDSTSLLELESLPKSLTVLGGGYIGAELAQVMARLGVEVSVICRSRLLPRVEPEVSDALTAAFVAEGIKMYCGITYEACRQDAGGVTV